MGEATNGSRPVIGMSAYDARATWGSWDSQAALLPIAYLGAITAAGGAPVILPVGSDSGALLDRVDGLVLTGGPDLDPSRYGEDAAPLTVPASERRDEFELALAALAESRDLPLLAICRGLQVLNVQRGGALHQHVPDVIGHDGHSPAPAVYGRTAVSLSEGSRLGALFGVTTITVDCAHHQAIKRLGRDLEVVATAEDGTIEAVEDRGASFTIGVQWHPEVGSDPTLMRAFVATCAARGATR